MGVRCSQGGGTALSTFRQPEQMGWTFHRLSDCKIKELKVEDHGSAVRGCLRHGSSWWLAPCRLYRWLPKPPSPYLYSRHDTTYFSSFITSFIIIKMQWLYILVYIYLPNPGIKPTSLASPSWAGRFFTTRATWEAHVYMLHLVSCTIIVIMIIIIILS